MGRPRNSWGEKTRAVWDALKSRPLTRADVARELRLSSMDANNCLKRLKRAGHIYASGTGGAPVYTTAASRTLPDLDHAIRSMVSLGRHR